jgi:hypothetical protein
MRARVFEGLKIKRKLKNIFGGTLVVPENLSCSSDDSEGFGDETETQKSDKLSGFNYGHLNARGERFDSKTGS